jgi:hypothetical protein
VTRRRKPFQPHLQTCLAIRMTGLGVTKLHCEPCTQGQQCPQMQVQIAGLMPLLFDTCPDNPWGQHRFRPNKERNFPHVWAGPNCIRVLAIGMAWDCQRQRQLLDGGCSDPTPVPSRTKQGLGAHVLYNDRPTCRQAALDCYTQSRWGLTTPAGVVLHAAVVL